MKYVVQERDPANVYDLIRYICDGALNAKVPFTLDIDPISCGVHIQVGSINICSKNDEENSDDADSIKCGHCRFAKLTSNAHRVRCSITEEERSADDVCNCRYRYNRKIDSLIRDARSEENNCSKNDKEKPVVDADSILCGACPFAGLSSMAYCVKCSLTGEDHADYDTCNCKSVYTKKITEESKA